SFPATYWIGAKGIDSEYSGVIEGSNNIVKVGPGKLLLDGIFTNIITDNATYTNFQYSSPLTNLGSTTISNGVLALTAPVDLAGSPNIILAGATAILDASSMGYVSNTFDPNNILTNSVVITSGRLTVEALTEQGNVPQT